MGTASLRVRLIREALTAKEWARVGGMVATIITLWVVGFAMLGAAAPHHYRMSANRDLRARNRDPRPHAWHAPRLRRRPHLGDRQHDPQVAQRGQAAAERRLLLLPRALDDRLRHVGVLELRHPRPRRTGEEQRSGFHNVTEIVGTWVSGFFLYIIAALNVMIFVSIIRVFLDLRQGKYDDDELESSCNKRGLMNRFFGPLARRIDTPWKMYPIGVLFGLGFDTATEVALLVLSGTAVASGLPFYAILSLPILFAAGMCTFDTIDGCFMNFAYGWAFARPIRKVYYNITITGLSVIVAFLIGTIELLGLLPSEINLRGGFWSFMANFNINTRRVHHRRDVRRNLGRRPLDLALRPCRSEMGRSRAFVHGPRERRHPMTHLPKARGLAQIRRSLR